MAKKRFLTLAYGASLALNIVFWLCYGHSLRLVHSATPAPVQAERVAAAPPVPLGLFTPPPRTTPPSSAHDSPPPASSEHSTPRDEGAQTSTGMGTGGPASAGASGQGGNSAHANSGLGTPGGRPSRQQIGSGANPQTADAHGADPASANPPETSRLAAEGNKPSVSSTSGSGAGHPYGGSPGQRLPGGDRQAPNISKGGRPQPSVILARAAGTPNVSAAVTASPTVFRSTSGRQTSDLMDVDEQEADAGDPDSEDVARQEEGRPAPLTADVTPHKIVVKVAEVWTPQPGQKFALPHNLDIELSPDMKFPHGIRLTPDQMKQLQTLLAQQINVKVPIDVVRQIFKVAVQALQQAVPPKTENPAKPHHVSTIPKTPASHPHHTAVLVPHPQVAKADSVPRPVNPFHLRPWNVSMLNRYGGTDASMADSHPQTPQSGSAEDHGQAARTPGQSPRIVRTADNTVPDGPTSALATQPGAGGPQAAASGNSDRNGMSGDQPASGANQSGTETGASDGQTNAREGNAGQTPRGGEGMAGVQAGSTAPGIPNAGAGTAGQAGREPQNGGNFGGQPGGNGNETGIPKGAGQGGQPGGMAGGQPGGMAGGQPGGMAGENAATSAGGGLGLIDGETGDGEDYLASEHTDTGAVARSEGVIPDLPSASPSGKFNTHPGGLVLPPSPPVGTDLGHDPNLHPVAPKPIATVLITAHLDKPSAARPPNPPAMMAADQQAHRRVPTPYGKPRKITLKPTLKGLTTGSTSSRGTVWLGPPQTDQPYLPVGSVSDLVDPPLADGQTHSATVRPKSMPSPQKEAPPPVQILLAVLNVPLPPLPQAVEGKTAKEQRNSHGIRDGSKTPLPVTPLPDSITDLGDGSGLKGEYYTGREFDHKVFTRADKVADFDCHPGESPDPRLEPGSDYTVRWTGKIEAPTSGTYTLYVAVDDGARVWIDHELVLDAWISQSAREYSGTYTFQAGHQYDLKIEYLEVDGGSASIRLYWEGPGVPKQFIPESAYFYPLAADAPTLAKDKAP